MSQSRRSGSGGPRRGGRFISQRTTDLQNFERLERLVHDLIERYRALESEQGALRQQLGEKDERIRELDDRLREMNQTRQDVGKRLDDLITQLDAIESQLPSAPDEAS